MLARANSDAAARLRRSKSASTVHKRPTSIAEPLDLDAIRQQALAAATTAFARAQAHDAIEHNTRCSSDLSRSKSNASRKSLASQSNHFPPRGSSFRSMQIPKVEQGKGSQRKSHTFTSHTEQTTEQPSRFHLTPTGGESLPVPHQLSKQPSFTLAENAKPSFQQSFFRPGVASSVALQQIRKARSMYYASSIQTGSPIARPPAKYLTPTLLDGRSPGLENSPMRPQTRTSRRSPMTEPRLPVTVATGMTVAEARDEYLNEFQQSSMRHKPSMFSATFKKRQDKVKDKAKSGSSDAQPFTVTREDTPIGSTLDTTSDDFMPQQYLKEKRSFSGSLKHRIKRVFRRASTKPTDLPVQHIKASRQYFDAPHLSPSNIAVTSSILCPDETTLQRVRGRASSLEKARPACLRSEYRSDSTGSEHSARSLHSEVNAHVPASRVTSWGTTLTGDTLAQRSIKRMTVIHESKNSIGIEADRVSSATASRRKSLPVPPLSSFRDPMPMHDLPEEESCPIDPKRVFSALMREIGTTKSTQEPSVPAKLRQSAGSGVLGSSATILQDQNLSSSDSCNIRTEIEIDQQKSSRRSVLSHSVRSKTNTANTFQKAIRSTIRAVTPARQHLLPDPEPLITAIDVVSMHENDRGFPLATTPEIEDSPGGSSTTKRRHVHPPYIPSASQIEKRMEKSRDRWKAHLENSERFQFPRETDKTYDVTVFARQTCATPSDSAKSNRSPELYDHKFVEEDTLGPQLSSEVPKSTYMNMPMSPSIYSRNTDGISINLNDSVTSFDVPGQLGQFHNAGSAVVLNSQSVRSYVVGTPSPPRLDVAHTSRDWRAWLSHEISSMELSSHEDLTINEIYRNLSKRDLLDSTHVSNPENEDTAVVQGCLDVSVSHSDANKSTAAKTSRIAENSSDSSVKTKNSTIMDATSSEEHNSVPDTSNNDEASGSCSDATSTGKVHNHLQPGSASLSIRSRPLSTPNVRASYHADIDTPKRITRGGWGSLTINVRRSRSNSLASGHSISSANGMAASSMLKSPKSTPEEVFRSSLSAQSTDETSQYMTTTSLKKHGTQVRRKENLTPKSLHVQKQSTPSLLISFPQPYSHQILISSTSNCSSPNPNQLSGAPTPGIDSTKSQNSIATTPFRPRVRVVAHPISPEKHAYRQKSALNLQTAGNLESPTRTTGSATASSPPRPKAYEHEIALNTPLSTSSLFLYKEPCPTRADIAATEFTSDHYIRSATPGHRMADQFLRQRNSTLKCEERTGKRKGSKFLVREDTPAFL